MENFAEKFRDRTKKFSIEVITLCRKLPKNEESKVIKYQLLKSATSVAANYRAVCRARSDKEFFAKLSICVEEADETVLWLELIMESGILDNSETKELHKEAVEIMSVLAKSRKSFKENRK